MLRRKGASSSNAPVVATVVGGAAGTASPSSGASALFLPTLAASPLLTRGVHTLAYSSTAADGRWSTRCAGDDPRLGRASATVSRLGPDAVTCRLPRRLAAAHPRVSLSHLVLLVVLPVPSRRGSFRRSDSPRARGVRASAGHQAAGSALTLPFCALGTEARSTRERATMMCVWTCSCSVKRRDALTWDWDSLDCNTERIHRLCQGPHASSRLDPEAASRLRPPRRERQGPDPPGASHATTRPMSAPS